MAAKSRRVAVVNDADQNVKPVPGPDQFKVVKAARLRVRTEGAIVLVDGSLYPALQSLIRLGLAHEIRVESRKRIVGLTPEGRELTRKTIAVLERLVGVTT